MAIRGTFRSRFLLFFAPGVLQVALSFLTLPLTTLILGPSDYAIFALVVSYTTVGSVLSLMGATYLLSHRFGPAGREERARLITTVTLVALVASTVLALAFVLGWALLAPAWEVSRAIPFAAVVLAAVAMVFATAWSLAINVVTLSGAAGHYVVVVVTQSLLGTGSTLAVLFLTDLGVLSLFIGLLTSSAIGFIGAGVVLRPHLTARIDAGLIKEALRLGGWLALANGVDSVLRVFERTFISSQIGFYRLGLYTHAQQYQSYVNLGAKPAMRAVWPETLEEAQDTASSFERTRRVWRVLHVGITALAIGFALLGRDFLDLFTHGKFTEAAPFAAALLALPLIQLSGRPQVGTIYAFGRGNFMAGISIVAAFVALSALIVLVPAFGIAGAIAALYSQSLAMRIAYQFGARRDRATPWQDGWPLFGLVLTALAIAFAEVTNAGFGLRVAVLAGFLVVLAIAARHVLRDMSGQILKFLALLAR